MKKKLVIALIILSAAAAGIFYFLTLKNIGNKYNIVEAEVREIEKFVEEDGRISSKNTRSYYGNSADRVGEIDLELGDYVKKGQFLFKYEDNTDIEIQKVEKQIEALEATYNEALSGADFESINSIKIEIASIRSSIDFAEENKKRIEELYKNEATTESELEQAENNLEQLQNSLAAAQNSYNQLVKGLSGNMKTKYEAEIDVLLLTLENLKENKDISMVYADFDGLVTELNTFKGDIPSAGVKILEIQNPKEKIVLVDFMVEDALMIEPNMKAEIKDGELGIQIDNLNVSKIHPKAFTMYSELGVEENRQTIEIDLKESGEKLPIGLKVKTMVTIEESREVLLVPKDAVYEEGAKNYVELLEDGELVQREVITGIEDGSYIEIKEGLNVGEKVILKYEEN